MIEKILFATDLTGISVRAQEYTLQIASATKASVIILHAIEPVSGVDLEADTHFQKLIENLKQKARDKADDVVNSFKDKNIECELRIEMDKRWQAVVQTADAEDVDLIVLGGHAIHEDGKVYLGTTSHKVFFSTNRPLMVVSQA